MKNGISKLKSVFKMLKVFVNFFWLKLSSESHWGIPQLNIIIEFKKYREQSVIRKYAMNDK